ncbi:hypothetical protein LX32DRAFT_391402 [Colletotrichum zoysiae]|uniref:Secreted protein n=1 Tax=Colletotrichum zoysiae TaxID=1216348 RepID=A0AAD9HGN6_9PEZI|nr:hypothetical protein LX32DRAFT_391402 [Colletotrichum zoysiae]
MGFFFFFFFFSFSFSLFVKKSSTKVPIVCSRLQPRVMNKMPCLEPNNSARPPPRTGVRQTSYNRRWYLQRFTDRYVYSPLIVQVPTLRSRLRTIGDIYVMTLAARLDHSRPPRR